LGPRKTVRDGYDKIASTYSSARRSDSEDVKILHRLVGLLSTGAVVLDAGCGSGYPIGWSLIKDFHVIGIDFSKQQLLLARKNIRGAVLVCGDITKLPFHDSTFDAIISYYSIIHIPRSKHREVLLNFHRLLKAGGLALLCLGAGDLPVDTSDYYGTEMFWSHYDKEINSQMLADLHFTTLWSGLVRDPIDTHAAHLFALVRK
jgi:ubiquinone/menaquinone biosynthesis C-methylase UbiE